MMTLNCAWWADPGWMLGATKAALSPPSSTGQGTENIIKGLWAMAIRLVNHDFPLVNPCWLVLITFLAPLAQRWPPRSAIPWPFQGLRWGWPAAYSLCSPCPFWSLVWRLLSPSSQASLLTAVTIERWWRWQWFLLVPQYLWVHPIRVHGLVDLKLD